LGLEKRDMFLKRYFQNILKKDIYKNTLILFSGSSVAQIIPLLATLILTRIFTKEQFGVFFIYSSLCMVLSMFITLRLELSIVLPSDKNQSKILLFTSIFTSIVLSVFLFITITLFYTPITKMLGDKNIGSLLLILPFSLILLGITQSYSYWFNRNNRYKTISIAKILKSTTSSIIQIILGLFEFMKYGLIAGLISGQFIAAFYSIITGYKDKIITTSNVTLNKMFYLVKKYKEIPIFNTGIAVSNTLSNHLPIFLLSSFYSLEITALYGLANRIIATPLGLISESVGQVLFNEASKRYNQGENIRNLVKSAYKKLFKTAIIPTVLLTIFAPYLFSIFFGKEWEMAGTFTQLLIPWLFLMFLNSPMSYIIIILNKQKQLLIYDILLLISRFFALYAGYKIYNNTSITIIFYALVGALFNLFLLFYILKISNTTKKVETN